MTRALGVTRAHGAPSHAAPGDHPLMSAGEVAAVLGVSLSWVWSRSASLPCVITDRG